MASEERFPKRSTGQPKAKAVRGGPLPLFRRGEVEVRETPLFVLGTWAWAEQPRRREAGKLVPGWGVEMTNGSRWDPCLPSRWIIYLRSQ